MSLSSSIHALRRRHFESLSLRLRRLCLPFNGPSSLRLAYLYNRPTKKSTGIRMSGQCSLKRVGDVGMMVNAVKSLALHGQDVDTICRRSKAHGESASCNKCSTWSARLLPFMSPACSAIPVSACHGPKFAAADRAVRAGRECVQSMILS